MNCTYFFPILIYIWHLTPTFTYALEELAALIAAIVNNFHLIKLVSCRVLLKMKSTSILISSELQNIVYSLCKGGNNIFHHGMESYPFKTWFDFSFIEVQSSNLYTVQPT